MQRLQPSRQFDMAFPAARSRKMRACIAAVAVSSAMSLTAGLARAGDVQWDNYNSNGIWDNLNNANWGINPTILGDTQSTWNNANGDGAILQSSPGGMPLILGSNVSASSIDFTSSGYSVSGPYNLNLVGGTASLNTVTYGSTAAPVNGLIEVTGTASSVAEIDSSIKSTIGLEKVGAGILILGGSNTITGSYPLTSGTADVVIGGYTLPAYNATAQTYANFDQGGTLRLASASALQPTVNVDIGQGYLDIGSFNTTIGSLTFTSQNQNGFNANGITGQSAAALSLTNGVTGTGTLKVTGAITALAGTSRPQYGDAFWGNGIATNVDFNGGTQQIVNSFGSSHGLIFTGTLSNGSAQLTGGADLFGNNTYTGFTNLSGGAILASGSNQTTSVSLYGSGTMTLLGSGGAMASATTIALGSGSQLTLDNFNNDFNNNSVASSIYSFSLANTPLVAAGNNNNRLNPSAAVTIKDAIIGLRSQSNGPSSVTFGSLNITGGVNFLNLGVNGSGGSSTVNLTGNLSIAPAAMLYINSTNGGSVINFNGSVGTASKVFVAGTLPTADPISGIIPNIEADGNFVTYNSTTGLTPATYSSSFTTNAVVKTTGNINVPGSVTINALNLGGVGAGVATGSSSAGTVANIYSVNIASGQTVTVSSGMIINSFNNYNTSASSYALSAVNVNGGTLALGSAQGQLFNTTTEYWVASGLNAYNVINLPSYTYISSAITGSNGLVVSNGNTTSGFVQLSGSLSGLSGTIQLNTGALAINTNSFNGNYKVRGGVLTFQTDQTGSGTVYLGNTDNDALSSTSPPTLDLGSTAFATFNSSGGGGGLGNTNPALAPANFGLNVVVNNGASTAYSILDVLYDPAGSQTVSSNFQLYTPLRAIAGIAKNASTGLYVTTGTTFTGTLSGAGNFWMSSGNFNFSSTSVISNSGGLTIGTSGNTARVTLAGTASSAGPITLNYGNSSFLAYQNAAALPTGPITVAGSTGSGAGAISLIPLSTSTIPNQMIINADLTTNASSGVTSTWTGALSGAGNLFSQGAGTLIVSPSSSTFNGTVNTTGGTIALSTLVSPSLATAGPGGTLGINGSPTYHINVSGGRLYPGAAAPTVPTSLTIAASQVTLSATGKLVFDLTATGNDQITFTGGSPTLAGGVVVIDTSAGALTYTSGETFQLINYNGAAPTGSFSGITNDGLPVLPAGLDWSTSALSTTGVLSVIGTAGGTWTSATSDTWASGNLNPWDNGTDSILPGGQSQTISFGDAIGNGAATVTVNGSHSAGILNFSGTQGGSYTLANGTNGVVVMSNGTNPAQINVTAGAQTISAPISFSTSLNLNTAGGSSLVLGNISGSSPGALTVSSSNTTIAGVMTIPGSLNVSAGSSLVTTTGIGSTVGTINVATGGSLNISSGNVSAGVVNVTGGNLTIGTSGLLVTTANAPTTFTNSFVNIAGKFNIAQGTSTPPYPVTNLINTTMNISGTAVVAGGASTYKGGFNLANGSVINIMPTGTMVGTYGGLDLQAGTALNLYGSLTGNGGLNISSGATATIYNNAVPTWYYMNVAGNLVYTNSSTGVAAYSGSGILVRNLPGGGLNVATGTITLSPSATSATRQVFNASSSTSLILLGGGSIELGNNDISIKSGAAAGLTKFNAYVQAGYNGGLWNGVGSGNNGSITSIVAANDPTHLTAVGVIQNNQSGGSTGIFSNSNKFDGVLASGASDILIKYTYYGDANLDGQVTSSDYTQIDVGFLNHKTGWYNGDFNYDGVVNGSDYTLIDNAFNTQGAAIQSQIASPTAQIAGGVASAVPEPASLSILSLGAAALLGRRRRKV